VADQDGSTFSPSSGLTPPVTSDLSLPLQVNLSAQILQTNGRLYHFAPASPYCLKTVNSRVPLLPRNYSGSTLIQTHPPPSHLLAHFPLFTVIEPTLLRKISFRDEEGFSSCSACPCHRAVATTPPEWMTVSISFRSPMLPSPYGCGLGLRGFHFRGHPCVHFRYGPVTRSHPQWNALSMGFRQSVSLIPAIQATGLLIVTLAGLSPAEHASLSWTHIRTWTIRPYGSSADTSHEVPQMYTYTFGLGNSFHYP